MTSPVPRAWRECRVTLPQPHTWLVLDLESREPESWTREAASGHVAPAVPKTVREAFALDLLWYWRAAVRQGALCAAVLAPPDSAVIAFFTVRQLTGPAERLSVDAFRTEALHTRQARFGDQELSEVRVPLGPALRVHRKEPTAPDAAHGLVVEGVAHYVVAREHATALECRLLWSTLGFGEVLTEIADELAGSVRLV
ncbi:hypothetical protein ACFWNK_35810 [Streptomyces sp. NPDC058417]|uniref:hypothetical protein n=1 Tax=unclassified Streptomyces TaxID=2593676 RepID=UPI0036527321